MTIFGSDTEAAVRMKEELKEHFTITDLGEARQISVLRSSSVRFFDSQKGNRGPQPVQTVAQTWRTATEPNRTGPIQFGCPKRPVSTGLNYYFYSK
jgi:hypothetical protein